MFAAGARRVFFNSHQPLILNTPGEIDATLTPELVAQQRIQIASGHPMSGCALGGNARRDVVDSRGRSWDVDGLYVADSSILPTSLGVNPCYTSTSWAGTSPTTSWTRCAPDRSKRGSASSSACHAASTIPRTPAFPAGLCSLSNGASQASTIVFSALACARHRRSGPE